MRRSYHQHRLPTCVGLAQARPNNRRIRDARTQGFPASMGLAQACPNNLHVIIHTYMHIIHNYIIYTYVYGDYFKIRLHQI